MRKYSLACPNCRNSGHGLIKICTMISIADGSTIDCDDTLTEDGMSVRFRDQYRPHRLWCVNCNGDNFDADTLLIPDEKELAAVTVPNVEQVCADISQMVDTARFAPKPLPSSPDDAEEMTTEDQRLGGNGQNYTVQELDEMGPVPFNRLLDRVEAGWTDGFRLIIAVNWPNSEMESFREIRSAAEHFLNFRGGEGTLYVATNDGDDIRIAAWQEGKLFIEDGRY